MSANTTTMHLAFCLDQNYIPHFLVLLTSIFVNNKGESFHFHVVLTDATAGDRNKIIQFVEANQARITFYELDLARVKSFAWQNERYNLTTFYRLLLPEMMAAEVTRFIYLDVDTVVVGRLRELYDTELGDKPVGAVPDPLGVGRPDLGLPTPGDYFNAGVLLVNRPAWETQQISEKTMQFLRESPEKAIYVDQDGLNAVLAHNWVPVAAKFNFTWRHVPTTSHQALQQLVKEVVVVHYNSAAKPWHRLSRNRLDYLYHYYHRLSPVRQAPPYYPLALNGRNVAELVKKNLIYFYLDTPLAQTVWRGLKQLGRP